MAKEVKIWIRAVPRENGPDLKRLARVMQQQAAAEEAEDGETKDVVLFPANEEAS